MISRYEYLYAKSKIKKIENIIFDFENGWTYDGKGEKIRSHLYSTWEKWYTLDPERQGRIKKEWEQYYQDCRTTVDGRLFQMLYRGFRTQDKNVIKKCVTIAKTRIKNTRVPTLRTPTSIDPDELGRKMIPYFALKQKLAELKKIQEEYAEVYESKDDKKKDNTLNII